MRCTNKVFDGGETELIKQVSQVTVIPLALGFSTLASNSCLGRSLASMLMIEFMKASCRWEIYIG